MIATNLKRRKILLALASVVGGSLTSCVMPPGLVIPNAGRTKSASKRSAQEAFSMQGGASLLGSITQQHAMFKDALTSFRQDFMRGENLSCEALNERVTVPFVALMHRIFTAVDNPSVATSKTAKIINGKISIPAGSTLVYTQKGYCMNKSVPAPVSGDALELRSLTSLLDADLVPSMKAVGEWSTKNPENASRAQMLTWGLMDVGTDRGGWIPSMAPDMRNLYDGILPGTFSLMAAKQNGYALTKKALGFMLEKTKLDRYISADELINTEQDHKASNQLLDELIRQGKLDNSGKGIGYSDIADNIYTRTTGAGVLAARVEIFNDSDGPFLHSPQDYYAQPLANKQPISPTPSITDLVLGNNVILSPEMRKKLIEMGVDAATSFDKELAEKSYGKMFDWLKKKTPGAARSVRKLMNNSALGKIFGGAIGATPILGNALSAYEFISGKDWMTGEALGDVDRLIAGLGTVPGANTLRVIAKGVPNLKWLKPASRSNLFKFVDSPKYAEINNYLGLFTKVDKNLEQNQRFNDPNTSQMKSLVFDASLPWQPQTLRMINDVKAGLATF